MQDRNEYLDTVCGQIRFSAARKTIRRELDAHIDDRIAEGKSEAEVIAAMGDAVQTGKALSSVHRPRIEWCVIASVLLLSILSCVITLDMTNWPWCVIEKDLLAVMALGIALMTVTAFLNYAWLKKLSFALYGAALLNIIVYFVTLYPGDMRGGGEWLSQTSVIIISEFLFILGLIGFISYNWKNRFVGFSLIAILSIVSVMMIYKVNSEYGLLLALTNIAVFTASRWVNKNKNWPEMLVYFCLMIAAYLLTPKGFFSYKIDVYLYTSGYNTLISNILRNAQFIGPSSYSHATLGFSDGSNSYYLIAAIIGNYGWLAGLSVAAVCGAIGGVMLKKALTVAHTYGRLLTVGVSAYFLIRFTFILLVNMNIVGGSFSLPFISFGRIEYIADAVLVGIFLSVWRRSTFMKDEVKEKTLMKQYTATTR